MSSDAEILQRIQELKNEKKANQLLKRLAELDNELYAMDVKSVQYDVNKGYCTQKEADVKLAKLRKKYFG